MFLFLMTKAVFLLKGLLDRAERSSSYFLHTADIVFHSLNATDIQSKEPVRDGKEGNRHFVQGDETGRFIPLPT